MADEPWRGKKPLRDVDFRERKLLAQRVIFGLLAGAVMGSIGYIATGNGWGFWGGFAIGVPVSWKYIELWGRFAAKFYMPTGHSTPYRNQHSEAAALILAKQYDAALHRLELDMAEDPKDVEPYLIAARMHRDKLQKYDEALAWFKRARSSCKLEPGTDVLIGREMVELYARRLKQPERGIPELARLAEKYAGTPAGELARRELLELRQEVTARMAHPDP